MEITGPRQPLTFFQAAGAHYKERFEAASTKAEKVTIKKQFFEVLRGRRIAYHRANGNVYNLFNSSVATRNIFYFSKISYVALLVFPRIDKITLNQYISYYVMPFLPPEGREALYSYLDRYGPLMTISEADIITCFKEHLSINILSVKFPDVLTAIESIPSRDDIKACIQVLQKKFTRLKNPPTLPTLDGDFLRNFDRFMQETKFNKITELNFRKDHNVRNLPRSLALIPTLVTLTFNGSLMDRFPAEHYRLMKEIKITGSKVLKYAIIDGRKFSAAEKGEEKSVELSRNTALESIHFTHISTAYITIKKMTKLTHIYLHSLPQLKEISFEGLPGLQSLQVINCPKLEFINLKSLWTTGRHKEMDCKILIKNISPNCRWDPCPRIKEENITFEESRSELWADYMPPTNLFNITPIAAEATSVPSSMFVVQAKRVRDDAQASTAKRARNNPIVTVQAVAAGITQEDNLLVVEALPVLDESAPENRVYFNSFGL